MKQISRKDWENYIKALSGLSQKAAQIMQAFAEQNGLEDRDALIRMQYALATKYGEASASLACQMYDAVAEASGAMVPPAEPAETATYKEAAIAVNGALKQSPSGKVLPQTTDRLVKQAAADTTLKNSLRDGAQFAWVPNGDTCAFCLTLASRGWQYASKKTIQGGHADHIHANCDCTFAIRFDNSTTVAGYDPDKYKRMYYDVGNTPKERLNTMRRIHYAENREEINAQKRAAYASQNGSGRFTLQEKYSKAFDSFLKDRKVTEEELRNIETADRTVVEYLKREFRGYVPAPMVNGDESICRFEVTRTGVGKYKAERSISNTAIPPGEDHVDIGNPALANSIHERAHDLINCIAMKRAGISDGEGFDQIQLYLFNNERRKLEMNVFVHCFDDESTKEIYSVIKKQISARAKDPGEFIPESIVQKIGHGGNISEKVYAYLLKEWGR